MSVIYTVVGFRGGSTTYLKQVLVLVYGCKLAGRNVAECNLEEIIDFRVIVLWRELRSAGNLWRKCQQLRSYVRHFDGMGRDPDVCPEVFEERECCSWVAVLPTRWVPL